MSNTQDSPVVQDYLIRGHEYLKSKPDFKLVGRDEELKRLSKALTRESANSVLLVGPGGVGCSTLCVGLQASKDDANAPFDIVGKRFFWLDTDGLFSSGSSSKINDSFQKALGTLSRMPNSVLVIDDMRDFVDAAQQNGCTNLINALMREIKNKKFQAVFESDDDDIEVVLKCHSDMKEGYTLIDVNEPAPEALSEILEQSSKRLEKHHKIKISEEARATAIELTSKYRVRDLGLSRAQPERSVTLLDRALTSYRLDSHSVDPRLSELNARLDSVIEKIDDPNYSVDQGGKTREELETERAAIESDMQEVGEAWEARQKAIQRIYKDLRIAETKILEFEEAKEVQRQKEEQARVQKLSEMEQNDQDITQVQEAHKIIHGIGESNEIARLNMEIDRWASEAEKARGQFDEMTSDIDEGLELTKEHVLAEFSAISGVPVSKLTQNEKVKLRNLEANLGGRVWGQDQAVHKLADEVLIAKAGLQDPNKPQGAFLYVGPSGVGKTELAKALASEVLDDEGALLRFDMSEYQEKHALAKLIGAPPGYEGYEAGGILTNEMRRNPRRIILFDEIEKAHPDIFLLFLQILDDARLTDNRGLTVSFADSIILMTSNAGKEHFVNPELTFEQASELAMDKLGENLPPELLNRFNGRQNIVCFNSLPIEVIEKIAKRELGKLSAKIKASKPDLDLSIETEDLKAMCADNYEPVHGARGIQGFISGNIKSAIAKTLLFEDDAEGVMKIEYDKGKGITVNPPVKADDNVRVSAAEAAAKEFSGGAQPS